MIESSLTVHDEILQKELSSNADDKMKNIVTTIQREQNRIIRNEEAHVLPSGYQLAEPVKITIKDTSN